MGAALFRHTVIVALMSASVGGCVDLCGNKVLSEAVSPDGRIVATAYERNCGATTAFARVVGLRAATTAIDYADQKDMVLTMKGQPDIRLVWDGPTKLAIEIVGEREVFIDQSRWKDVTIIRR